MTIQPPRVPLRTLADLVASLGNIPLARIQLTPPPGTATEADLLSIRHEQGKRLLELIGGTLVELPMGNRESLVAAIIARLLGNYVEEHRLGLVLVPDSMFRMSGGNVRLPDVAFLSRNRLVNGELPDESIASFAPDLAVEVLSPSNTADEISQKVAEYFASGTRLVWIIDPVAQAGEILLGPNQIHPIPAESVLTGAPVLPGYVLPLGDIFSRTRCR